MKFARENIPGPDFHRRQKRHNGVSRDDSTGAFSNERSAEVEGCTSWSLKLVVIKNTNPFKEIQRTDSTKNRRVIESKPFGSIDMPFSIRLGQRSTSALVTPAVIFALNSASRAAWKWHQPCGSESSWFDGKRYIHLPFIYPSFTIGYHRPYGVPLISAPRLDSVTTLLPLDDVVDVLAFLAGIK